MSNAITIKTITPEDIESLDINIEDFRLLIKTVLEYFNPIQHKLNQELTGNDKYHTELVTNKGKAINFGNCVISEGNELLDSTPWRHWKGIDGKINYSNLELEIVDQYHFIPSILLCLHDIYPDTQKLTDTFVYLCIQSAMEYADGEIRHIDIEDGENGIAGQVIESLSAYNILYGCNTSMIFRLKKYNKEEQSIPFYDCTNLENMARNAVIYGLSILYLWTKIHSLIYSMSFDDSLNRFKRLYLVKNCLNRLRSKNGYKEGFYLKDWLGREDNDVALEIAADMEELDLNVLYSKLEEKYQEVKQIHKKIH